MSMTHRSDAALLSGFHHSGDRGLGVRGDAVPSSGQHGPAFLYSGISLPSEAADEFRISILTIPAGLESLFVDEDSSATTDELAQGTYSGTYRAFRNGISYGIATYTITVGAGSSVSIRFSENLDPFFDPADGFTADAILADGSLITVIFDDAFYEVGGVSSTNPAATCRSADVADIEIGSEINIRSHDYRVVVIEPDGSGVTVLRLHKQ